MRFLYTLEPENAIKDPLILPFELPEASLERQRFPVGEKGVGR
jgi:hypothetical protein